MESISKMSKYAPLVRSEFELLNWSNEDDSFSYENLVRIRTPLDGSCFFHAIAKAMFIPYRTGINKGYTVDRFEIIRNMRNELSLKLSAPINEEDPTSPMFYDVIFNGELRELAKRNPEYTLENLQKRMASPANVTDLKQLSIFMELISSVFDLDIYLIDLVEHKVIGKDNLANIDDLYADRPSIVIGYTPSHCELLGVRDDNIIKTKFHHDSAFINTIRTHIKE
jgi:hypothetical protein